MLFTPVDRPVYSAKEFEILANPINPTLLQSFSRTAGVAIAALALIACSQLEETLPADTQTNAPAENTESRSDRNRLESEEDLSNEDPSSPSQNPEEPDRQFAENRRGDMTPERLIDIAEDFADNVQQQNGILRMTYEGVTIGMLWDEDFDRMRLIAEVGPTSQLSGQELQIMMEANYHLTLDARYATSQGVLYATFIHPLSPLDEESFLSGIHQVSSLVQNFGTTYSSDALTFGGEERSNPPPAPDGFLDI